MKYSGKCHRFVKQFEFKFMRKYIFFSALTLLLFSCSGTENKLHGRWKLTDIDYSQFEKSIPEANRADFREAMEDNLKRILGNTYFTFGKEDSLKLESPDFSGNIDISKGSYHLNDAGDSLFLSTDDKESYVILTLTDKALKIRSDESPERTLTLSKVN